MKYTKWLIIDKMGNDVDDWVLNRGVRGKYLLISKKGNEWFEDLVNLKIEDQSEFILIIFRESEVVETQQLALSSKVNEIFDSEKVPIFCHYGGNINIDEMSSEWDIVPGLNEMLRDCLKKHLPDDVPFPIPFSHSGDMNLDWYSDWNSFHQAYRAGDPINELLQKLNTTWEKAVGFKPQKTYSNNLVCISRKSKEETKKLLNDFSIELEPSLIWYGQKNSRDYSEHFDSIESFLFDKKATNKITVIVNEIDYTTIHPYSQTWSGLISLLILAFPEVNWIFLEVSSEQDLNSPKHKEIIKKYFGIDRLIQPFGTSLFDAFGLRNNLRELLNTENEKYNELHFNVPVRSQRALILDDEFDFCYYQALMAYCKGLRVHAIETWKEAKYILNFKDDVDDVISPLVLSIEDLYLNYPDQYDRNMSSLKERTGKLKNLNMTSPNLRRFVTVGHEIKSEDSYSDNDPYLKERAETELNSLKIAFKTKELLVYKPVKGIYTHWIDLGLHKVFSPKNKLKLFRNLKFFWSAILSKKSDSNSENQINTEKREHSAPGRVLKIAQSLLKGIKEFDHPENLKTAVYNAIRATDALELLAGKTPTTSIEALSLKHYYEVMAECQFVGVEYKLSLRKRLDDIKNQINYLAHWINKDRRKSFKLNAEAGIISKIMGLLEKDGRFEEMEVCRAKISAIRLKIEQKNDVKSYKLGFLLFPIWFISWYINFALKSLLHITSLTLFILILFTSGFWLLGYGFICSVNHTLSSVFALSIPPNSQFLGFLGVGFGILHFGLLTAYIYSRFMRR